MENWENDWLDGGGRKPFSEELEHNLLELVLDHHSIGLYVSRMLWYVNL